MGENTGVRPWLSRTFESVGHPKHFKLSIVLHRRFHDSGGSAEAAHWASITVKNRVTARPECLVHLESELKSDQT